MNLNWTRGLSADGWVRIHRGTPYGNPFSHREGTQAAIVVGTREEAVDAYRTWLTTDLEIPGWPKPTREMVISLWGKILGCFCKPLSCHGDVLIELAEQWVVGTDTKEK